VACPAFVAIRLTIVSTDGRPHRIVARIPRPRSVMVRARGRVSISLPGLRAGRYDITVDGAVRGALVTGGEPGP
jgi:hypothetical protein